MQVTIKKWGNSASVRIPAGVMDAARLTLDTPVDVREEDGRIIIERLKADSLAALLEGITDDNRHLEIGFGVAVGQEAF